MVQCDQRPNYFERLSDDEGEDAAENREIQVGVEGSYIFFFPFETVANTIFCPHMLAISQRLEKAMAWRRVVPRAGV